VIRECALNRSRLTACMKDARHRLTSKILEKSAERPSISYPNFLDWQRTNSTFASMAAYRHEDFNITGSGEPERVRGGMVSTEFFPILGVKPLLGRLFVRDKDGLGAAPVALLAEGFWQRRFGSARDIIGKQIIMKRRRLHHRRRIARQLPLPRLRLCRHQGCVRSRRPDQRSLLLSPRRPQGHGCNRAIEARRVAGSSASRYGSDHPQSGRGLSQRRQGHWRRRHAAAG
jgi:hypothetical protein